MTTELTILGHVPGMNTLLRLHWSDRADILRKYQWELMAQKPPQHRGKIKVDLWRHSCGRGPDQDNLVSTAKTLLDALKKNKTIVDDNPSILVELNCQHVKVSRKVQPYSVLRITDIE
ncbi:hypothetical protein [Larkinella terrae]|uniref:Uncharacterized protein n=1 Tax=Larkinella terrae TaxID=2025311 RepID=A0A7K0EIY9_9BACT|nr:hypothetical protein [Larkinella terrae]MRS61754.1 hypothetical protein [Larkinella terrae]